MIQRIQTLFLLAAAVLSGLMLKGELVRMGTDAGTFFSIDFMGLTDSRGEVIQHLWPLTVLLALVPLLALI